MYSVSTTTSTTTTASVSGVNILTVTLTCDTDTDSEFDFIHRINSDYSLLCVHETMGERLQFIFLFTGQVR